MSFSLLSPTVSRALNALLLTRPLTTSRTWPQIHLLIQPDHRHRKQDMARQSQELWRFHRRPRPLRPGPRPLRSFDSDFDRRCPLYPRERFRTRHLLIRLDVWILRRPDRLRLHGQDTALALGLLVGSHSLRRRLGCHVLDSGGKSLHQKAVSS